MGDPGPILCGVLCLAGAALLSLPRRRLRRSLLTVWALTALVVTVAPPTLCLGVSGSVREYTFAHYHLGARYFDELGYDGLYEQAAAAGVVPGVEGRRDLRTYAIVTTPPVRRGWTPDRWEAFVVDLQALAPRQDARSWRSWFRDKGYNASPAWTATWGRALGARPAGAGWFGRVAWVDVALLLIALAVAGWAFGPLDALLCGATIALFYGSAGNLLSGPLQLDWLAATLLAAAALQRGRMGLGGALFAWAVVSRVFPAVLLAGPIVAAWAVPGLRRPLLRFAAGFGLVLVLGLGVGSTTGRGPGAWGEFVSKVGTHATLHHAGDKRVGWSALAAWAPVGDRSDAEARDDRAARWPARRSAATAVAVLLALGWAFALRRGAVLRWGSGPAPADPGPATVVLLLLGLPLCFALVTLSRYYVLLPALVVLLRPRDAAHGQPGDRAAWVGAALLASSGLVWWATAALPDATAYFVANLAWAALGLGVMIGWVRPR
jgi:hypothetical protein